MDTFPRGAAEFVMSKWAPPALHRSAHESRQPPYWMLVVKPIENYMSLGRESIFPCSARFQITQLKRERGR
jgi:hypothetical protein